jgi:hypothetical protein
VPLRQRRARVAVDDARRTSRSTTRRW